MSTASSAGTTQVLRIRNTTQQEQELWIEPLGDRVLLAPGGLYELMATNALEEINFSAEGFVIHGWVSRVAEISDDGSRTVVWKLPE